jgi:hypothetical protein
MHHLHSVVNMINNNNQFFFFFFFFVVVKRNVCLKFTILLDTLRYDVTKRIGHIDKQTRNSRCSHHTNIIGITFLFFVNFS